MIHIRKGVLAVDFGVPKPPPQRGEAYDVVLSYGDFSIHTRVEAKSHMEALDKAHETNRKANPDLPRRYRSGNSQRVHGKAARQEAFA